MQAVTVIDEDRSEAPEVGPEDLIGADVMAGLPREALAELAACARHRRYGSGEIVFREGAEGNALQLVRSGTLKVVQEQRDADHVLQLLTAGDIFGELAVLNSTTRLASVIAADECETIEISKMDFDRVLHRHPQAVRKMLGGLARSLTLAKEELALHNRMLECRVEERTEEVRETQLEVVRRLSQAAESRDDETGRHIHRMSHLCAELGRAVGLSAEEVDTFFHAAPMHDIGKICIPDRVLLKPGRLTAKEWETMKAHTTRGADLLTGSRSTIVKMAEQVALTHHERWDGKGYPRGLKGTEIPLVSRICAVCDVFDALTSVRPYKGAWTVEAALVEIEREGGRHFDPALVAPAVQVLPRMETWLAAAPGHPAGVERPSRVDAHAQPALGGR